MTYGKRIRLRGAERSDLPKYYEWINDLEVKDLHFMSVLRSEWDSRREGK